MGSDYPLYTSNGRANPGDHDTHQVAAARNGRPGLSPQWDAMETDNETQRTKIELTDCSKSGINRSH